jgi:hypothetical protein
MELQYLRYLLLLRLSQYLFYWGRCYGNFLLEIVKLLKEFSPQGG